MAKGTVNKCIFIGRLGDDPKIHQTQNGNVIASFSLATNDIDKDKETISDWHNIKAFGKTAELIQKYVTKGSKLYIECKHKTSKYDDKNGVTRYSSDFIVMQMQFLGGGKETTNSTYQPQQKPVQSYKNQAPQPQFDANNFDDDIPF